MVRACISSLDLGILFVFIHSVSELDEVHQISGLRSQVLARARQRFLDCIEYELHVLDFVYKWAHHDDRKSIKRFIGSVRHERRDQLDWFYHRIWPLRLHNT